MKRSNYELQLPDNFFHPGFSVDCVVLGFHNGKLKVLLNKFNSYDKWMLPGGFVYKDEDVDEAAYRHLRNRTGLQNIYLRQFCLLGKKDRTNIEDNKKILKSRNLKIDDNHWLVSRFITMAYYALVEYSKVVPVADPDDEIIGWFDINNLPDLYGDHGQIIKKALETLKLQVGYIPIGHELLPEKFTMPELRAIYETFIGKELDRRNFQRKILATGIIQKSGESRKTGGAHKSPHLYKFDENKFKEAIEANAQLLDWRHV